MSKRPDRLSARLIMAVRQSLLTLAIMLIISGAGATLKAEEKQEGTQEKTPEAPTLQSETDETEPFEAIPLNTIAKTSNNTPLVVDEFTGLAIYGFDPVHYFANDKAEKGIGIFEYSWQGGYWWFVNIRNRDVFIRDPDIYAPVYGGYDPVELSRGRLVAGDPYQFLVSNDKLYLFAKKANMQNFTEKSEALLVKASEHWQKVNELLN